MALFKTGKQTIPGTLLHNKFGWPPFSILNTISWNWQRRKDEWEVLFRDSTEGRNVKRYNATPTNTFSARGCDTKTPESVSEFDPYLCELMYKWFSLPGMKVLDPFAGGCVRGVVAAVLERNYLGIDLSAEQVLTNGKQAQSISERYSVEKSGNLLWLTGDADTRLDEINNVDMVFTCPPYYNLERYSNDPRDLSNMPTYEQFLDKYGRILQKSADLLNDDCFFVIVVSEIRASSQDIQNSAYRGFVPDTIKILQKCGLQYYNEIILENAIGSLPIRAPKYMDRFRKVGRHHQNVLVFYKGNIGNIENKFGKIST